jgi:GNAT superfamily N-acetyltransferase
MGAIEIRPLQPSDDRSRFSCGNPDLDRFFARYAGQNQFRHHVGTTYVAIEAGAIKGFATLSASHIEIDRLPAKDRRRLPSYPLPVLRLARLAVDQGAKGLGVGKLLLRVVFRIAHEMALRVGCVGIVVDAKPEAVAFYERYGFEALEVLQGHLGDRPEPLPMFLPLAEIPPEPRGE